MKRWLLFLFIPTACYANTSQPLNICSQDGTVSNYPYQLQVTPTSALTDNNNGTMLLNVGSGGGTPGGAPSQLQYNNTGAFGGVVNSTETATGPIISSGTLGTLNTRTFTVNGIPNNFTGIFNVPDSPSLGFALGPAILGTGSEELLVDIGNFSICIFGSAGGSDNICGLSGTFSSGDTILDTGLSNLWLNGGIEIGGTPGYEIQFYEPINSPIAIIDNGANFPTASHAYSLSVTTSNTPSTFYALTVSTNRVVNIPGTATISSGTINQFYASTATVQGSPSSSLIVNAGLAADNTDRQMIQLINANTTSGGNTQTSLDVFEQAANHVGQLKWSDYSGTSNKGIDLRIYTSLNGSLNGTAGLTLSGNYNATTGTRVGINSEAPGAILDVEGVATTGTDSNPILKLKPNNVNATGDVIDGYSHNGTLLYSISDAGNETVLDGVTATTGTFTTSITAGTTAGSGTQLYRCSGGTDAGWMLYGNSSAAATLCTGGGGSLVAESIFVP